MIKIEKSIIINRPVEEVWKFVSNLENYGQFEYALLKRADAGWWQAIAGGGEANESAC